MKHRFILFFLISPILSFGQRQIVGRAIDSETKLPIKNITISTEDNKGNTFTNHLGFFELAIDESVKKLNVDHVSYGSSEIVIPEQSKFIFALTKRDLEIPLVDLRSFGEYSRLEIVDDSTIIQKEENRSVYFEGGFAGLYNYLGDNIKIKDSVEDKFICLFPDTVFSADVHFTVTKLGKAVNALITGDTLFGMSNIIVNAITKAKWEPAFQRGEACDQNVWVKIYFGNHAFVVVDTPASFPLPNSNCIQTTNSYGNLTTTSFCIDGYYKYINDNIVYPAEAKRKRITGSVFVQFIINKKGNVVKDKIKVIKGLGYGLDEEAIRLISNCPDWKPASQRGVSVYQSLTLPIKFQK
jgi:TonB family protein